MVGGRAWGLACGWGRWGRPSRTERRGGSAARLGSCPLRGRRRVVLPRSPVARGARPRGGRRVSSEATDRGTWRLVARRDFWVRIRERSFLISTLINIAVISILVLARASSAVGGGASFDLGYVGPSPIATGAAQLGHDAQPPIPI